MYVQISYSVSRTYVSANRPPVICTYVSANIIILLRYGDLMVENCEFFLPHSHLTPSLGVNPFEFLDDFLPRKAESLGLGYPSVKIS